MMWWKNKIRPTLSREMLQDYLTFSGGKLPVCRAPFTSLYFFPDGQVGSCCLNKSFYTLGVYPDNSINKIIKSKKRKEQQKHISANNFSKGCQICSENINTGNFSGVMATDYNKHEIGKNIKRIDFELSDFCNLDCVMCGRNKKNKKSIYNDNFFEEIKPYLKNIEATNFLGGEPFLIDIYYKIWDYLLTQNENCNINIQSNGTVINEKIFQLVSKEKVFISLSIDSVNKTTYEKIRRGADFDKIIKNFDIFNNIMQKKLHSLYISVCPIAYNASEIPEIVKFANQNNCRIFFNRVVSPAELSLDNRSEDEYNFLLENYYKKLDQLPTSNNTEIQNKNIFKDFIKLVESQREAVVLKVERLLPHNKLKSILLSKDFYKLFPEKEEIILKCLESVPEEFTLPEPKYNELISGNFDTRYFAILKSAESDTEIVRLFNEYFGINSVKIPLN